LADPFTVWTRDRPSSHWKVKTQLWKYLCDGGLTFP